MAFWACSQNCVTLRQVVRKRQDLTNMAVGVRELSASPSGNLWIQQFQQTHWALLRSLDSKTSRNHCAPNTCPCSPPTHPVTCIATEKLLFVTHEIFQAEKRSQKTLSELSFLVVTFFKRILCCYYSTKNVNNSLQKLYCILYLHICKCILALYISVFYLKTSLLTHLT